MSGLAAALRAEIERRGPIGFDEFQLNALYAPAGGFYFDGSGAGRRRDFLTSPEVGPLFGAVLGRALDAWWTEFGEPEHLTLVEAGAGPGTLARTILAARPRCLAALRIVLVELTEVQWSSHPPTAESRATMPRPGELGPGPVVVVANELLDNLPIAIAERTDSGWDELVVAIGPDGELVEALRALDAPQRQWCDARAPGAAVGSRIPVQSEAAAWLDAALRLASPGRVVVFDYARTTEEMAAHRWTDWLRTYARHGRGSHPLAAPGSQDITCDVAVDQLQQVAAIDRVSSQSEFLERHGIGSLVEEARAVWQELGLAGGLPAIAARSAIGEAAALTDPDGLGGFAVLEWRCT